MRQFLIILLLLTSWGIIACSGYKKLSHKERVQFQELSVFGDEQSILYKTNIEVARKSFSGLIYFKFVNDSTKRIVFLSEFGLTFLDVAYFNREFEIIKCQKFLDRDALLKTFINDMRLIIEMPELSKINVKQKRLDSALKQYRFKTSFGKFEYLVNENNKVIKIEQKRFLGNVLFEFDYDNEMLCREIRGKHKNIGLLINLKRIDRDAR
jgi:hypothetical protein